jgi:hypothetical protein
MVILHPASTDSKFGWEYLVIGREGKCRDEEVRKWVYRYDETLDEISIWSVPTRDDLSAGKKVYWRDFGGKTGKHEKDVAVASRFAAVTENEKRDGGEGREDVELGLCSPESH